MTKKNPDLLIDRLLVAADVEEVKTPEQIADEFSFDIELVRSIAVMVDRNEYRRK